MPRITPVPVSVFECVLEKAGYKFKRQSASHKIFVKQGCFRPLVIPIHGKELDPFIIKENLRTAGITRDQYFEMLAGC